MKRYSLAQLEGNKKNLEQFMKLCNVAGDGIYNIVDKPVAVFTIIMSEEGQLALSSHRLDAVDAVDMLNRFTATSRTCIDLYNRKHRKTKG